MLACCLDSVAANTVQGNQRYTDSDTGRLKRNGDPDDGEKEMLTEDTNEKSQGRAKQKQRNAAQWRAADD